MALKSMNPVATIIVAFSLLSIPATLGTAGEIDRWWLEPQRMVQTNLREIDATMDLDRYVREIKDFGANVVLFNVGGIVANYPTDLRYHYRNPYMKGDLVGTVLERLHAEGIRVIGRFDFSKINEKFAAQRPEWLYVSEKGEYVNYNGQVHTCVSAGYQQEYMFEILGEAVDRYPLDGVFFNMIGYQRSDYSRNYHGLCQCEACKTRFREFSGMDLPSTRDDNSPVYKKYLEFTRMMSDRQFNRVNAFLKAKRPDLAICTYTPTGVDIIRKESNRPLGRGTYVDTDKAKSTLLTAGERQLANCAVHFIDIPYRHAAVSPYLTTRRIWQLWVNGAWLDFYCIGPLQRQEDRTGLDLAQALYRFHADNEKWLKRTKPAAEVALVRRGGSEYDGLMQILCENQVAFELTTLDESSLRKYPFVVVPDAGGLGDNDCAALDAYVSDGGRLLLTGKIPEHLKCMEGASFKRTRPAEKGSYIRIREGDRRWLGRDDLKKLDLVFLQGPFHVYEIGEEIEGFLRLIPGDMFGPPEKCYYREVSDHPALLARMYGQGAVACFPWGVGSHYEQQCHQGHASLVMGTIDSLLKLDRRLRVTTSPLVEVTHRADEDGRFEWVALFNHSGQQGKAIHAPVPIRDIAIDLKPQKKVKAVRLLHAGTELPLRREGGRVTVTVPQLDHYEVVLFEYEPDRAQTQTLDQIRIRDPFILADESSRTYFMYAQMGNRIGKKDSAKGVEVYASRDLKRWEGPWPVFTIPEGFWADRMVWAPEVHKHSGRYYLFVTFTADETMGTNVLGRPLNKRGTQVLVADSPKGPFTPFHNRAHTPADWLALDGTLWVEDGVPWMVFCHEWVQTTDGTMELVRLKKDLSDVDGEPVTLFRASDAPWVRSLKDIGGTYHGYVTDGPFLYRTKNRKLLMIWSSFGEHHYAVGLAQSASGKIAGPWKQLAKPLFAANGGHGMILKTFDNRLLLVLHQPNTSPKERARLIELKDTGDSVVLP